MTELELYKFIQENEIEYHWRENNGNQDVVIFPPYYLLSEFENIAKPDNFSDNGGIECRLQSYGVALWMLDVCEYYGIELINVFPDKEN